MLRPIDDWFLQQDEPARTCLQCLRQYILRFDNDITEKMSYGMPFYYWKGQRFCYLWMHKKFRQPYIGIVDGKLIDQPGLLAEDRSRMKILLLDPHKNVPVRRIHQLLKEVIALYK